MKNVKKTNRITTIAIILSFFLISACAKNDDQLHTTNEDSDKTLMISAATSLSDALLEIKQLFEERYPIQLTFNFGGSGKLAKQIERGASVDIFISADEHWINLLNEKQFVKKNSVEYIVENELVLIAERNSDLIYNSLLDINIAEIDHLAVGHPDTVPAGMYTREILQQLDLWDQLQEKFVYAQDVRQVLTYVETGNAQIGFVYNSDTLISEKVKTLIHLDDILKTEIIYPAAIMKETTLQEDADNFLQFLLAEEAQEIFESYGFKTIK